MPHSCIIYSVLFDHDTVRSRKQYLNLTSEILYCNFTNLKQQIKFNRVSHLVGKAT